MCSGVGYEVVFHGSTLLAAPVRGAAARVRCNVRCTSRSSRAAREWYSRRLPQGPRTVRAPLCAAHCGFFSVNADFRWYYSIEQGKCQGRRRFCRCILCEMSCCHHPDRETVAQCSQCGKPLCETCTDLYSSPFCADCVKRGTDELQQELWKLGSTGIIMAISYIACIFFTANGYVYRPLLVSKAAGRIDLPAAFIQTRFQTAPPLVSVISIPCAFNSSRIRSASAKFFAFLASYRFSTRASISGSPSPVTVYSPPPA